MMARYGEDACVAEPGTDGILRLRHYEWLLQQVPVDAEWFGEGEQESVVARSAPKDRGLMINFAQEYWRW